MSNLNMNQNKSFWDFVQQMQNNPAAFPFAQGRGQEGEFDPFAWGPFGGPGSHRGRRHGHPGQGHRGSGLHDPSHSHARGPSPPPEHEGSAPPPPPPMEEPIARSPTPPTPPETPAEPSHHPHSHREHEHRGSSSHHRHGGPFRGRGGFGRRGGHDGPRRGNPNFPFDLNALAEAFAPALFGSWDDENNNNNNNTTTNNSSNNSTKATRKNEDGSFTPEVDVFDTSSAYMIHASLPGAKKADVDITYTAARNSVSISGVVMRPGVDEALMNTLAQDERKVGSFQREIKLDEKVKIDEDGITAKLEDGVLRVTVPKVLEEEDEYVTVKRVQLE